MSRPAFTPMRHLVAVASLAALCAARPASANWSPFPGGVTVSSQQAVPDVRMAADGSGGTFVAWRTSAGGGTTVLVQHLNSSGAALWTAGGVQVFHESAAFIAFAQGPSSAGLDVCPDAAGGAFVVWTQGDDTTNNQDVYALRFNSSGVKAWALPVAMCNFAGNQTVRGIVPDGSDGAVVAWDDARNQGTIGLPQGWQVYAQRFFSSGTTVWTGNGMQISTGWADDSNEMPGNLRPLPDGIGGYYFAWAEGGVSTVGTSHIQRINQFANAQFAINGITLITASSTDKTPGSNAMLSDGSGGCIVVSEADNVTHVMLVTSTGTQPWGVGGYTATHSDDFYSFQSVTDGAGGVIVVGENRFFSEVLRAFRVTSTGATPWGADGVVISPVSNLGSLFYQAFGVAADGLGGALVAYGVANSGTTYQVFVQGLDANGRRAFSGNGLVVSGTLTNDPNAVYAAAAPAGSANALFAWGDASSLHAQQVTLSDLDATFVPPGWAFPVVPRHTNDATLGNVTNNGVVDTEPVYLNWVVNQAGPNPMPAVQTQVYLDYHDANDFAAVYQGDWIDPVAPAYLLAIQNLGPLTWDAGLHTLTLFADPDIGGNDHRIDQSNTANDIWSHQFTVIPHWELAPWQKVMKWPPIKDHGALPNGFGHKFLTPAVGPGTPNAWVVGVSSKRGPTYDPNTGQLLTYGDDYGLLMFDVPPGAQPFVHQVGASQQPMNLTEFMVALAPSNPDSIWPLVVRDSTQDDHPDSSYYSLMYADGRVGPAAGSSWLNQNMMPGELADVFMLNASVRQVMKLSLRKQGDPGPIQHRLAFEVFEPIGGTYYSRGGGIGSHTLSAQVETLTFVATHTGPYPVVVFRDDGSQAESAVVYDFSSSNSQTLDAGPLAHAELALAGATPNPALGTAMLMFTLPVSGEARLELYDVSGRRVRTLAAGRLEAGEHQVRWDARGDDGSEMHAGLYWARLTFDDRTLTRRLTLLR